MSLRKMKKLLNIEGCLKQFSFTEKEENNIFLENWYVNLNDKK